MMAKSSHYKANNKGGYGNPPVKYQFKGEPGPGRPKGSRSIDNALRKTFGKKVVRVDRNGRRSHILAPDALAERALELGLKSTLAANVEARKLAAKYGPQDVEYTVDLTKFTAAELHLYGYLALKAAGQETEMEFDPAAAWILQRVQEAIDESSALAKQGYWDELKKSKPEHRFNWKGDEDGDV